MDTQAVSTKTVSSLVSPAKRVDEYLSEGNMKTKSWSKSYGLYYEDIKEDRTHITKLHVGTSNGTKLFLVASDLVSRTRLVAREIRSELIK